MGAVLSSSAADSSRLRINCDAGWRFHLGDEPRAAKPGFDAAGWRSVHLPHDWSIEGRTDPNAPSSGGGGFFPSGTGWYRRAFDVPAARAGKRILLEFEGVYTNAEVWINGHTLGVHPNGFTTFFFDITPHVKPGEQNVIAVRVDNSHQPNARFYTGSGIYRHVWMHVTEPVHIGPWGVFISTRQLTAESADVSVQVRVRNDSSTPAKATIQTRFFSPDGSAAKMSPSPASTVTIAPGGEELVNATLTIASPQPWSPETPRLYRAVTTLSSGGVIWDEVTTTIGLRTIRVSAERGFQLNGTPVELNGANVHSDHGPLGAAAFDAAERRKARILKAAGYNAVRTAHNPPAPAFLEACDREGLLVIEEAFDCWEKGKVAHDYSKVFKEWWQRDLDAMVLRDRNHPSVVMWSIGNEVYERGSASGARIATDLTKRIRELDTTRPLTAGINGMGKGGDWTKTDPVFSTLDVAGYNYELGRHADDHSRLPARVMAASESYQSELFENWRLCEQQPYVIGDFVWSGLDYLGEAGIGRVYPSDSPAVQHWIGVHYPWHGAACGDIDITGWRKPVSHYRNIVWNRGEKLYAAVHVPTTDGKPDNLTQWSVPTAVPSWSWSGHEGKPLQVEVYSRHEAVAVYLNRTKIGEKPTTAAEAFKATFEVPYAPGSLRVVGIDKGSETQSLALVTANEPLRLRLQPDRTEFQADHQDLVFVTVEACDRAGHLDTRLDQSVQYAVKGPATIVGVASGDMATTEPYTATTRRLFNGRSLVVLRATGESGSISLTARSPNLGQTVINLTAVAPTAAK